MSLSPCRVALITPKGKMDERMEGRREGKLGKETQVRWKSNRIFNEKGAQWSPKSLQNRSQIVPKRRQGGQEIKARSSRRPEGALEADSTAMVEQLWSNLEPKIDPKPRKIKTEIIKFSVAFLFQKYSKMDTKTTPKSSPIWSKMGPNSEPK